MRSFYKIAIPVIVIIAVLVVGGSALASSTLMPSFAKSSTAAAPAHHTPAASPLLRTYWSMKQFMPQLNMNGGFTPAQLQKAYGLNVFQNKGQGMTVAVVDAFGNPNVQADLNKYSATFGWPTTTVTEAFPQGQPATINESWALETNLDVQMVHAMAPRAKIVVDVAVSPTLANLMGAVKDAYVNQGADVVSMSFGGAEFAGENGAQGDGIFLTGHKRGVSFTASSGDKGTGAQYPAASPFVTAVGGTSLTTQADGTRVSEIAWKNSGGGLSQIENRPAYQANFNKQAMRGIPDVAMVADPNTGVIIFNSFGMNGQKGFFVVGGTSVSAPLFAGVLAVVNQHRNANLKNTNTALYNAAEANYAANFHDIVTGSNGTCGAICQAQVGYDFVTGLGSPASAQLVPSMAAAAV
jgi:subtilase family serine protease